MSKLKRPITNRPQVFQPAPQSCIAATKLTAGNLRALQRNQDLVQNMLLRRNLRIAGSFALYFIPAAHQLPPLIERKNAAQLHAHFE
jgi:hypothetical protein